MNLKTISQKIEQNYSLYITPLAGLFSILIGTFVLLFWTIDITILYNIFPQFVTMKANTAIAFLLAGIALCLLQKENHKPLSRMIFYTSSFIVLLIGILSLLEFLLSVDLGIDQLIFKEAPGAVATVIPGRMSFLTAICFSLIGISLLLARYKYQQLANGFSLLSLTISFLVFIGYVFNVRYLFDSTNYTNMAINTAVTFAVLSIGILFAHPKVGFMSVLLSQGYAGSIARRIFPIIIFVPIILWRLILKGELLYHYSLGFAITLQITFSIIILSALIWMIVQQLYISNQNEATYFERKEWFSRILLGIGDGMIATDSKGNITLMNPVAESLTGWTLKEATGKPIEEIFKIVHEATREKVENPVLKVIEQNKAVLLANHTLLIKRNGVEFAIDDSAAPIFNEDDELSGVVLIFRDVTKQREFEHQQKHFKEELELQVAERTHELNQREEKLKEVNHDLNTYIYKTTHDLRGPLTSIMGLVNISKNETDATQLQKYIQMIDETTHQLDETLLALVDLISVKDKNLSFTEIDFHFMNTQILNSLRFLKGFDRINFRTNINITTSFVSDSKIIYSILQNLIENAIKYQNYNSTESTVTINVTEFNNGIKIEIADNGVGIDEDILPRVFEIFYRGSNDTKGSGLGLYIVKVGAEKLKGTIAIQSKKDIGTTITIHLPNQLPTFA